MSLKIQKNIFLELFYYLFLSECFLVCHYTVKFYYNLGFLYIYELLRIELVNFGLFCNLVGLTPTKNYLAKELRLYPLNTTSYVTETKSR